MKPHWRIIDFVQKNKRMSRGKMNMMEMAGNLKTKKAGNVLQMSK